MSEWTAIEPSAFITSSRRAGSRRAPRRPSYSTEHTATTSRTGRVVPRPALPGPDGRRPRAPPYHDGVDSVLAVDFYGEVLREIVVALGAALFVANLFALLRRNADLRAAAARRSSGNVPAAPSARTCASRPPASSTRHRSGGRSRSWCSACSSRSSASRRSPPDPGNVPTRGWAATSRSSPSARRPRRTVPARSCASGSRPAFPRRGGAPPPKVAPRRSGGCGGVTNTRRGTRRSPPPGWSSRRGPASTAASGSGVASPGRSTPSSRR